MSGQLIETKKRIKSVTNTKKITKAMELVATSKMKVFQGKAISAQEYSQDLINMIDFPGVEQIDHVFFENREQGSNVFVLYSSDKGLCGPMNNKLIRALFTSKEWLETQEKDRILITIGSKSKSYAKYNKIPVDKSFDKLDENVDSINSLEIIDAIIENWMSGKAKRIYIVVPHFKNTVTFYPLVKTYLPLESDIISDDEIENNDVPLIEPDAETFSEKLGQQFVITKFMEAFLNLKASEYSNRMLAMQNATKAADEMVDSLTLAMNKARQAAITQEITEIVSGAG